MSDKSANKIWKVYQEIGDDFVKKFSGHDRVILQLAKNRGLDTEEKINDFLDSEGKLFDPFLFNDMEKAVDLIIKHIKNKNKIFVYGDYDADGVTSSCLLVETLETLCADVDVFLPDRVSEGYGLNKKAIDFIASQNTKLIITTDGGVRNVEEVKYAQELGLDVVITDHHPVSFEEKNLPNCLIINPALASEKYPYKLLAGVGVAFKLVEAIVSRAKISEQERKILKERVLDLVAIGTVADCVSLLVENRILVKKGLKMLNSTKRKGLRELFKVANIDKNSNLKSWNIGFQIGPRINAAGRMDHANSALKLLTTKDDEEAKKLSNSLNQRNIERQQVTDEIFKKVEKQIKEDDMIIIGVCEDDIWNEGVVGLVAGKISEKYYRPALVITKTDEGYKGSGRSIEEFNLAESVEKCSEHLDKYGGHPMACGFSFAEENLGKFKKCIAKIANKKLKGADLRPRINIEAELKLEDINEELIEKINKFEPFGQNNDQPKFTSSGASIVDIVNMGVNGQHLKLKIKNEKSDIISAIGFGQSEKWRELKIGSLIDIVYYLEMNEFNGKREAQMKIVDINKL
ncbi:MAG: single-stranded-DNA-specific exonuclease RecJ [bacterium]